MANTCFGDPENPHRVGNCSKRLFLAIFLSILALAIFGYFFSTELLEKVGGVIMLMVTSSMSLGLAFVVYRAVSLTIKKLGEKN